MTDRDGLISGAAILGLYAGIKLCIRDGYDWRKVAEIVAPIAEEHARQLAEAKSAEEKTKVSNVRQA